MEHGRNNKEKATGVQVSGILVEWNLHGGTCTFQKLPVAMMWVDSTLAGLMSGVQAMVGTERFLLALQSEGRKSVEADWQVISQFSSFSEGFKAIANIAAVAGWGEWALVSLDEEKRECRFRVANSWEGRYQKALGVHWGSGMLAGKMAGYCSKLFGTNCWAAQTAFIAKGDVSDEFVVRPSSRSIEAEIENLLEADEATRADMAVALRRLEKEIADRTRLEATLKESEEHYRSLFDSMLNGYAYCQMHFEDNRPVDFTYLNVNKAFETLTGLRDVIGKKVSEVIPGLRESDPQVFEIYGRVALSGVPEQFETYIKALHEWFLISVYSPKKEHFVATFDVITARKQAEMDLRESEARFRNLFENMTEGVALHEIVYDERHTAVDYRILVTNPAFSVQTGLQPEQVQEKLASTAYGTGEAPFLETYARVAATGQSVSFEVFFEPLKRHFYISATSPKPGYFVTVFEDITERKTTEEALRRAHDELEQRVRERTADLKKANETIQKSEENLRLLASQLMTAQEQERQRISYELHDDLGQSLMVLKMRVNAFAKQLRKDQQSLKDDCVQTLQYVSEIADRLRSLSHELSPSILEHGGLVVALRHLFAEFIKYQDIEMSLDMDEIGDLFTLEEQIIIYRIFQEFLHNIAKHADATQLALVIKKRDGNVAFLVEDNGKGFDAQELHVPGVPRVGLGLAAIKERVRMLGGFLNIESRGGQGTRISFVLPIGRKEISN